MGVSTPICHKVSRTVYMNYKFFPRTAEMPKLRRRSFVVNYKETVQLLDADISDEDDLFKINKIEIHTD